MHKTIQSRTILFSRAALVLACGSVLFAGCGGQNKTDSGTPSGGDTGSEKKLSIVTPHSREIQTEFERLFKEKHPDVTIQWFDKGGTSELLRLVESQAKSGNSMGADLFFGGGAETFLELEKNDLLQPLPEDYGVPAALNGVPLRGENNKWVAAALSGFGMLVNQTFAKRDGLPIPATWIDMGHAKLLDRVELADPRRSGSAHTAYEIILQTNGWEKGWQALLGMAANARSFKPSSTDLVTDVTSGEAVIAPAIDFYGRRAVIGAGNDASGAPKLVYIEPKGQTVVTPDPIGLLKGAPHVDLAKEFVKTVLSPEGQKLWMLKKGMPGGPKLENSTDVAGFYRLASLPSLYKPIPQGSLITSNPYDNKNQRPYDAAKGAQRRQALDALLGAVLIDNRKPLKEAFKKKPNLSYVPLSEAELSAAAAQWDKASFRSAKTDEWLQAAHKAFE